MAVLFAAFACLVVASLTGAQQVVPGSCNATAQPDFDITKYTGVWFGVSAIPAIFEQGDTCSKENITLIGPKVIQINETATKNGKIIVNLSNATAPNATEPGKLVLSSTTGPLPTQAPYWILQTDYTSYTVVYSCTPLGPFRVEFAWVLSRTTSINDDIQKKVEAVFAANSIDMKGLKPIPQTNCLNHPRE